MSNAPTSSRGISPGVFIIGLLLAVVASAIFTSLLNRYAEPRAAAAGTGQASAEPASQEPLTQKDTISPESKYTGVVFYEFPYSSPPSLKLTAAKRKYEIVKQDEFGFTWMARPLAEDFGQMPQGFKLDDFLGRSLEGIPGTVLKNNVQYEDFTWEAKGLRGSGRMAANRPFEQTGTFLSIIQTEGEVAFAIPYAVPPNVELKGKGMTTITQIKPTGFKWKNGGDNAFFYNGDATWTAKGIRATDLSKVKAE